MKKKIFYLTACLALLLWGCSKDNHKDEPDIPERIAVTGITLSNSSMTLIEGDSQTLHATVKPSNATDKSVTWASSNSGVATVSATGTVTAVKEGTAEITATAGGKSAKCIVTVKKEVVAVTSVTISQTSLALTEGETATLTATVAPDNATDKSVTWASSNSGVAAVSATGTVTAVKEGTAEITATVGGKSAKCIVTVKKEVVAVTSVTISQTSLALTEGETATLTATIAPDNATDKSVTWASSNSGVAAVSATGTVTAVKAGTTEITAKAGEKTATCTVTVKAQSGVGADIENWGEGEEFNGSVN